MHKLFIILFLSYFYYAFSHAEIIKKIEISGNQRVSNETIAAYGDIDLNKENTPEFDQYSWVPFWFPLNQVVDFKKEAYRSALIEFKNQIKI